MLRAGAALGIVVFAWIVVTGLVARYELDAARSELSDVKAALLAGHDAQAQKLASEMRSRAESAKAHTSGPAWWVVSQIPGLGAPLQSARQLTTDIAALARTALPTAMSAGTDLSGPALLTGPSQIDVTKLAAARQPLDQAAAQVNAIAARLRHVSGNTWLGLVNSKVKLVNDEMQKLESSLQGASKATQLLPSLLGADGPRHYFVGFENEAEARGLGGLPGAYGILTADHGRLHFTRFGPDEDLLNARSSVQFGNDWQVRYVDGFKANTIFRNSDASPNFPYAAATWISMWQNQFHQHLDGAMALDPTALSYLLKSTGLITLSDGQKIGPGNVAEVLESSVYAKFPGLNRSSIDARKAYLVDAAKSIVATVTNDASHHPEILLPAVAQAVAEKRLVVYSTTPSVEKQFADAGIAGLLDRTARPFVGLVINNASGSKLDYYLDRSIDYKRTTCGATTATVTVKLTNNAPSSGLPAYVTYISGLTRGAVGQNYDQAALYLTQGADVSSVTLDGKRQYIQTSEELGHEVISLGVLMQPGQTRTLVYRVQEPRARGHLEIPVQPLVRDMGIHVDAPAACGLAA